MKFLGNSLSEDEGPQEDVKMRVDEGLKPHGYINVRRVSRGVNSEMYERVLIPTKKYGAETRGAVTDERDNQEDH